jgi:hypothetical protein
MSSQARVIVGQGNHLGGLGWCPVRQVHMDPMPDGRHDSDWETCTTPISGPTAMWLPAGLP